MLAGEAEEGLAILRRRKRKDGHRYRLPLGIMELVVVVQVEEQSRKCLTLFP